MILDDVFNMAAQDYKNGKAAIEIDVAVTTNQTGGFQSTTNNNSAPAPETLSYAPREQRPGGYGHHGATHFSPATFSSPSITITEPVSLLSGQYGVEMLGTSFVPAVDNATNVVYGVAGSVFVTISLCNYRSAIAPQ